MSRPPTPPDAIVEFELLARTSEGAVKHVYSGYRPVYEVLPDYWSSTHHEFAGGCIATGEKGLAEVWFLSPEAYPQSLWVGRRVRVAEGSRQVGEAIVKTVFNQVLLKNGA
jgi:hypothetical protein